MELFLVLVVIGILFRIADQCRINLDLAERDAKIRDLESRVAVLEPLVFIDALTGIGNRRNFDDALSSHVAHAMRSDESLVVLYLDVNFFKRVNDLYGHPFGDILLRRVAESLAGSIRPSDSAYRFGGDEFAVILVHCDVDGARLAAARIAKTLAANAIPHEEELIHMSVSIGGTCLQTAGGQIVVSGNFEGSYSEPGFHERVSDLLRQGADNRLYVAKLRKNDETYPTEIC